MAAPINYETPSPGWSAAGVEPPPEFKASGYVAGYKPPAGFFNWFWTLVSKCVSELQTALKTYATENEADKTGISAALAAHGANKANPHGVTAAQAGAIPASQKGAANGVAPLNESGDVTSSYLPRATTGLLGVTYLVDSTSSTATLSTAAE